MRPATSMRPDDAVSATATATDATHAPALHQDRRVREAATCAGSWALLLAGLLGGAAGGFGAAQLALQPVREALAARPPVVVQDLGAALLRVEPEQVAALIGEQQRLARRLGEAGALVLDADAVLAAPVALYVNRRPAAAAAEAFDADVPEASAR